jgi:hypothetical protein
VWIIDRQISDIILKSDFRSVPVSFRYQGGYRSGHRPPETRTRAVIAALMQQIGFVIARLDWNVRRALTSTVRETAVGVSGAEAGQGKGSRSRRDYMEHARAGLLFMKALANLLVPDGWRQPAVTYCWPPEEFQHFFGQIVAPIEEASLFKLLWVCIQYLDEIVDFIEWEPDRFSQDSPRSSRRTRLFTGVK